MRFQLTVQIIQHNTRLDNTDPVFNIKIDDPVQMLAVVDDDCVVDCLAAL